MRTMNKESITEGLCRTNYRRFFQDIYPGHFRCIYCILDALLSFSQADSVSVFREKAGKWHEVRKAVAANGAMTPAALPQDQFQRWLGEAEWHESPSRNRDFRIGGSLVWVLGVRSTLREVVPDVVAAHAVVFISSSWVGIRPSWTLLKHMAHWLFVLVSSWFSWVYYQREERQRWFQEFSDRKCGSLPPDTLLRTLFWPMPFQEVVEVLQAGWDSDPDQAKFEEQWSKPALARLCHPSPPKGSHCDRHGPWCRDDEHRQLFKKLADFVAWRFVPPASADSIATLHRDLGFHRRVASEQLNGKALSRFFAEAFWKEWLSKGQRDGLGPSQTDRCFSSCAHIVHYLLGEVPIDEKTIEALVWAVSRYGHDVLGIEPRLDIASHLLHAARNEPPLHVLRPFYRDHFFHALEVCFLGHLLLEQELPDGQTLLGLCQAILGMTRSQVLREWYVAALLHDIGRTIDVLNGLGEMLEFYRHSHGFQLLHTGIDSLLGQLSKDLAANKFEGFTEDEEPGRDHGVVAAEHLASLVGHIAKQKPGVHEYRAAQRAIAVHNHRAKVVDFTEEPLSFLLILCDTIQEWNRAHLRYATAAETILAKLLRGGKLEELTGPLQSLAAELSDGTLKLTLRYSEDVNVNAGVFRLWLDSTSNLQRLRPAGLPIGVRIEFVTPRFRKGDKTERQMDRLMDAAQETHMHFLADWFPSRSEGAVSYSDAHPDTEILALDLDKLARKPLITDTMEEFWDRLKKWKRYSEDREFSGDYAPHPPG